MNHLQIEPVDRTDAAALVAWNAVGRAAWTHGREAAWWASDESVLERWQHPRPEVVSVLLEARLGGELVGAAEASLEPGEPAEVEISVLPEHRRRGIGRALYTDVVERLQGQAAIAQAETYTPGGLAFAEAMGLEVGNREARQLLDLPTRVPCEAEPKGVTIRSWVGACPDDVVEDWALLTTQMTEDVPLGDMTRVSREIDVAEVRRREARQAAQGYRLVRSMALVDGRGVGYTYMFVSDPEPEIVAQDDTLVDRAYRHRGIGRALKLANLTQLQAMPGAERFRWVQTYTSLTNAPMLALNESLGFRVADTMSALEGSLRG